MGSQPETFYADFLDRLTDVTFKQHLMRYFVEFEVTRRIGGSPTFLAPDRGGSSNSFSNAARNMAREMVADARILPHKDITAWFSMANVREAIRRIENSKYTRMDASEVMAG